MCVCMCVYVCVCVLAVSTLDTKLDCTRSKSLQATITYIAHLDDHDDMLHSLIVHSHQPHLHIVVDVSQLHMCANHDLRR